MQLSIERMLKAISEVLQLLEKGKLGIMEDIGIDDNERQGKIWVIDMVGDFCRRIRQELVAGKWPERSIRAMRSTALIRAIEDMGWYSYFNDCDSETRKAFRLFEKVKKSYRRLSEIQENTTDTQNNSGDTILNNP